MFSSNTVKRFHKTLLPPFPKVFRIIETCVTNFSQKTAVKHPATGLIKVESAQCIALNVGFSKFAFKIDAKLENLNNFTSGIFCFLPVQC